MAEGADIRTGERSARKAGVDAMRAIQWPPELQKARVYEQVTYIPLGQYTAPSVWRNSLKGVLDGPATPVFWNIDKTE